MVHGFGGLGWLWIVVMVVVGSRLPMMGSNLLWVFWWWWISIYGGFVVGLSLFFIFRLYGRWLFKVVVGGLVWGEWRWLWVSI